MTAKPSGEAKFWYIDANVKVTVPDKIPGDEMLLALEENRIRLEQLKQEYKKAPKNKKLKADNWSIQHESPERQNFYLEIARLVNAIEALKSRLSALGISYPIDHADFEHPNEAVDRLKKYLGLCFVATVIYGQNAPQTQALRRYRDEVLAEQALGRAFIRLYYFAGPWLARAAQNFPLIKPILKKFIDVIVETLPKHKTNKPI